MAQPSHKTIAVSATASKGGDRPRPYRIVTREPVSAVVHPQQQVPDQDPYVDVWGPSPYELVKNSRADIANNHSHRNSLPAKSDIVARGASLELLVRILQCSNAQLEHQRKQQSKDPIN